MGPFEIFTRPPLQCLCLRGPYRLGGFAIGWKSVPSTQTEGEQSVQHIHRTCLTAAAAKSLQLCLTLCDHIDGSPPGSPVPGILQARILEWVAIPFSNAWRWKVKVKLLIYNDKNLFNLIIHWIVTDQLKMWERQPNNVYWWFLIIFNNFTIRDS